MDSRQFTQLPGYERFDTYVDRRDLILHNSLRDYYLRNPVPIKRVSIITPTNKTVYLEKIFENYFRQRYPDKELIIVLNNNQLNLLRWKQYGEQFDNVSIYQLDETTSLGECLNYAVDHSSGHYLAKFDDDDFYGPDYLVDLINCFSYTRAAVVGKACHFIYFKDLKKTIIYSRSLGYRYHSVWGGTHVVKREVFDQIRFKEVNLAEDVIFNENCLKRGFKQYVADPFNYLRVRIGDKSLHTYKLGDKEYVKQGILIPGITDPREFVTV